MTTEKPFVAWLDPGLVTGLATYDLEHPNFMSWQYEPDDVVRRLHQLLEICDGRMRIGWEKYLVAGGPHKGTAKYSLEIIGRLQDFALVHGVEVLPSQPSSARALGQVTYLRRLGWYKPGKPHANDASQHLLAHLLKMKPMPAEVRGKLFPGYSGVLRSAPE